KPEGIHLMIGRRPCAAFGNSTGDQQMLEYTKAGSGARLAMLVLHDDAMREYAYGPAQGLPDTKVGTFTQKLYDEATSKGWTVISIKNDRKRIFAFEQSEFLCITKARRIALEQGTSPLAQSRSSPWPGVEATPPRLAGVGCRRTDAG